MIDVFMFWLGAVFFAAFPVITVFTLFKLIWPKKEFLLIGFKEDKHAGSKRHRGNRDDLHSSHTNEVQRVRGRRGVSAVDNEERTKEEVLRKVREHLDQQQSSINKPVEHIVRIEICQAEQTKSFKN